MFEMHLSVNDFSFFRVVLTDSEYISVPGPLGT